MSRRSRSAEEVKLWSAFETLRKSLLDEQYADRHEKPLAFWARFNDRGLPLALLDRPLREVLDTPYAELSKTRGVGQKKMQTLVELLRRAADGPVPEVPEMGDEGHAGSNGNGHSFDPGQVSDDQWTRWCTKVKRFNLRHVTLGRLAPTLQSLPTVIWQTPLGEYCDFSLDELRRLKNHGTKRVRAILEILHATDDVLGSADDSSHILVRLVPRFVQPLESWIAQCHRRADLPTLTEMLDRLVQPLLDQIDHDLGDAIADLAARRLGIGGSVTSVQQLAGHANVTRARVYQLLEQCADVMSVRWPEGAQLLDALYDELDARGADVEMRELLKHSIELFFPAPDPSPAAQRNGQAAHAVSM